ncbi:uncharacterized protein MYCFIDRAFT_171316 [Pseudocercospora fijiensis CIRAD86]|uniref:Peptidase M12A domain-containing protein n=1 Tax=Pseudocercospora fijiensis (strain CIRAD86) TaxID=383855 RepID=M3B7T8_PSEFD|nr:uncharacterized protein MYCFIDRAFT_171316 [Pseudocercospora fijiensis CIRAD86]EME85388.1 hypothetical protein MYCFIDRAFT_171316 [Pseudocercospora fijiensis CIRAD86]
MRSRPAVTWTQMTRAMHKPLKRQRTTSYQFIETSSSLGAIPPKPYFSKERPLTIAGHHAVTRQLPIPIFTMNFQMALLVCCAAVVALAHSPLQRAAPGFHGPSSASNVTIWHEELNETSGSFFKRWLSIPELPSAGVMQLPYIYPWPRTCSSPPKRPVRYCYDNARSARNLGPLMEVAQAAWAAAMMNPQGQVSSLSIEPDPGCPRDEDGQLKPDCLCLSGRVRKDTLVISDETKDGDDDFNDSPDLTDHGDTNYAFAHMSQRIPIEASIRPVEISPMNSVNCAQNELFQLYYEFVLIDVLGHAMGLHHEHQRPDRDQSLVFTCRYVRGYFEVRNEVDADEFGLFAQAGMSGASKDQKMARVCSSWTFAEKYFPELADFLRADQFDFDGDILYKTRMQRTEWSHTFDLDSEYKTFDTIDDAVLTFESGIMIYDSGMASMDSTQRHWVLKRRDGSEIIMGGSKNEARITEGDVARIATLYAVDTQQNRNAREGNTGNDWTAVHRLPEDFGSDSGEDDSDDESDAKVKRKVEPRTMTIKIGNSDPVRSEWKFLTYPRQRASGGMKNSNTEWTASLLLKKLLSCLLSKYEFPAMSSTTSYSSPDRVVVLIEYSLQKSHIQHTTSPSLPKTQPPRHFQDFTSTPCPSNSTPSPPALYIPIIFTASPPPSTQTPSHLQIHTPFHSSQLTLDPFPPPSQT